MKKVTLLALILMLTACEKQLPFESPEMLAENPERLNLLNKLCKEDRNKVGDTQCNAVTEAKRIRFMGKGTPYTPHPVELFGDGIENGISSHGKPSQK